MKSIQNKWKKYLVFFSMLLCLALAFGNVACGTWSAEPSGQTVEAKKNKKGTGKSDNAKKDNTKTNDAKADDAKADDAKADDAKADDAKADTAKADDAEETLDEDGSYTSKEDVALYIHLYGKLPQNFITKKEAQKLGWSGGSLEPYAPGKSIGGSRFGNYEGQLPEADGRTYYECDIDTMGAKKRGAKRIVYSNDGLIYYTEDHYETFELLYGEE